MDHAKSQAENELQAELVAGRSCEGCTMCCKLLSIEVLDKPRGIWCPHCDKKKGCTIYEDRPIACRTFYCGYRRIAGLDERWKPSHAKFLVNYESAHNRIAIHADASRPDAWRAEPYYRVIKDWARTAEAQGGTVAVWAGPNVTVVSPGKDWELGALREDQYILPVDRPAPGGFVREYIAVEADDPRLGRW
ncbi:MAG TPA: YkgJ family cysteine cluster protein [Hyphomicrobium sp.]|nr:YkgJ family cysteine cluster protein [Hyphomicrobium sp.]